jgi:hypothetical protein
VTRTDRFHRVDPAQADGYAEVGRRLLLAGRAILERGDQRHAPALAILAVHAGIAFADAVCVRKGGRKSTGGDHTAVVRLLRGILGAGLPDKVERDLGRLIAEKDRFEDQGYVVAMREAAAVFDRAERCGIWAEQVLLG